MPRPPSALLCTAGLGTAFGGVGVVAEALHVVLSERFALQHLCYHADQSWRSRAKFAAGLGAAMWRVHQLRVFSHIDLTRSLPFTPAPSSRAPNVVFVHGIEVWKPLDAARSRALRRSHLLCNSRFTDEKMRQFHPGAASAQIVHLGVDLPNEVRSEWIQSKKANAPTVAIVGRMSQSERYKGHDQLIEAWPRVLQSFPDAQLLCIGAGDDLPRLRDKASALTKGVMFLSGLDDQARAAQVQSAHVFAFPSSGEGFGLAAVEAAAMGLPVLGLAGAVIEEILPSALLIPEQTSEALSQCLIQAFSDLAALHERGLTSMAWVRERYTRQHFAARFWQALDSAGIANA